MFGTPRGPSSATTASPSPSQSRSSKSTAHLQVVLARQRLTQAEAALRAAVEIEEGPVDTSAVPRAQFQIGVAARVRAVVLARHETCLRRALHEWRAANAAIGVAATVNNSTEFVPHPPASGGFLEVVLARLVPASLQWALGEWSRACAEMGRAASASALIEGKWAMQKAATLDAAHRDQLVKGVLRHWQQADLVHGWIRWQTAAALMSTPTHVRVSLA